MFFLHNLVFKSLVVFLFSVPSVFFSLIDIQHIVSASAREGVEMKKKEKNGQKLKESHRKRKMAEHHGRGEEGEK